VLGRDRAQPITDGRASLERGQIAAAPLRRELVADVHVGHHDRPSSRHPGGAIAGEAQAGCDLDPAMHAPAIRR
jgi:hypothetical protein